MENYLVVSKMKVSEQDVRPLVSLYGGQWLTEEGNFGIIQRGEGRLEVYLCDLSDYEPEEIASLNRILGGEPSSAVSVAFSTNEPSEALAREFCGRLMESFGGYFDDNITEIQ